MGFLCMKVLYVLQDPQSLVGQEQSIMLEKTQPLPEPQVLDQPSLPIQGGLTLDPPDQGPPEQHLSLAMSDGDEVWIPPVGSAEPQVTNEPPADEPQAQPSPPNSPSAESPPSDPPPLVGTGNPTSSFTDPDADPLPPDQVPPILPGSPAETEDGLEPDNAGFGESHSLSTGLGKRCELTCDHCGLDDVWNRSVHVRSESL